ncbi:MAG: hypothetical protein AB8B85_21100 [Paracoccaceae bacterium]
MTNTTLTDTDLDIAVGGQTREHVLLARQVSIPTATAGDDDDSGGVILIRPDGPYADSTGAKMPGMVKYSNVTLKRG